MASTKTVKLSAIEAFVASINDLSAEDKKTALNALYASDKPAFLDFVSQKRKEEKIKPKLTKEEKAAKREARKTANKAKAEDLRNQVKVGTIVKFRDGNKIDSAIVKEVIEGKDTVKLDVSGKGYLNSKGMETAIKRLRLSSIAAIVG